MLDRSNAGGRNERNTGAVQNENTASPAEAAQDAETVTATERGASIRDARPAACGAGKDGRTGTTDAQRKPDAMTYAPDTTQKRMPERKRRKLAQRTRGAKRCGAKRKLRWPATKEDIAV